MGIKVREFPIWFPAHSSFQIVDGMDSFTMASQKKNRVERLSLVTCFEQICLECGLYEAWRWAYAESNCLDFEDWHYYIQCKKAHVIWAVAVITLLDALIWGDCWLIPAIELWPGRATRIVVSRSGSRYSGLLSRWDRRYEIKASWVHELPPAPQSLHPPHS